MHIYDLSIASCAANNGRDNDKLVSGDKVPYTSLVPIVARLCLDFELQSYGKLKEVTKDQKLDKRPEPLMYRSHHERVSEIQEKVRSSDADATIAIFLFLRD